MMKETVTAILVAFACIHYTNAFRYLWGSNPEYNALCPDSDGQANVAKPAKECDVTGYLMCFHRSAIAVNACGGKLRFNPATGYCDHATLVPLPDSCSSQQVEEAKKIPQTCAEGAMYVGVPETCKSYLTCTTGGVISQPCPDQSFFINETGRCMYLMKPYIDDIPKEALRKCNETDPYITTVETNRT